MNILKSYFSWLQKDAPTGKAERYPATDKNGETSVKGVYISGDLTGIPLLKLAAENGKKVIQNIYGVGKDKFKSQRTGNDVFDVIIIGAGPAGISAGVEAQKLNLKFKILEASQKFNTIINYPKGKPIFAEPKDFNQEADLIINGGTKESLLEELFSQINDKNLPIDENVTVKNIIDKKGFFELETNKGILKTLFVVLAIGKSGNSRMLKVPGENLPKVYNRLFDPAEMKDQDVLIVGGGDAALETAVAVAEFANSTAISYRKSNFSRPKAGNLDALYKLADEGKIKLFLETEAEEIKENSVVLKRKGEEDTEINNSTVFVMIGKELPLDFFKRAGIRMEGELSVTAKLQFALLVLFAGVLYFGKSSAVLFKELFGKIDSWNDLPGKIFSGEFVGNFFSIPGTILGILFSDKVRVWSVSKYVNALVAYASFVGFILLGVYLLYKFFKENGGKLRADWNSFKYFYFIFVGLFFAVVFFGQRYFGLEIFGKSQAFWYTGLYSLTILIFGLRRMKTNPTRYVKYQTWSLILIQAIPLFILPEFVLPLLGKIGALGASDGFIMTQVFPNGSYWRSYGFILAWPLFLSNLYSSSITTFWVVFSVLQTFVIIPLIVYRWGKGAYCGWICSCGALAETLGNEYRTLAPHGAKAKKWENTGQWILLAAFLVTGLKLLSVLYNFNIPIINEKVSYAADFLHVFYYIGIDVIFAGVLGVGVYFFLSGRVWCRFGCPLAAWMHIVNRFSRYRIFSEKKKCISCNICTKVCHMGIDVMSYANKGIPLNDVECVRCSECVVSCPTQTLSFGSLPKADLGNKLYKEIKLQPIEKEDWGSGLS